MQDKIEMLLTATQKDQAIKEEKARQEGIAEGERVKALKDAKALLDEGITIDIISRCTGLSIEEIESL